MRDFEPCDICGKKQWKKIKSSIFYCESCDPGFTGWPFVQAKVFVQGYGLAEKGLVDEIKRRVILPESSPDGSNVYVGRRGENGKLQDHTLV